MVAECVTIYDDAGMPLGAARCPREVDEALRLFRGCYTDALKKHLDDFVGPDVDDFVGPDVDDWRAFVVGPDSCEQD